MTDVYDITINLLDSDKLRWSPEKVKRLFDDVSVFSVKIYEELIKDITSMNSHSLDMINVFLNNSWKSVKKDKYLMFAISGNDLMIGLMMHDQEFVNYLKANENKYFNKVYSKYLK